MAAEPDRWHRESRRWVPLAWAALALGYSFAAAATTPFTVAADVVTAVPIVALAVAAVWHWPWRPVVSRAPAGARHPYRAWLLLGAAIVVWELVDYAARGSRAAHPTLSSMADAVDRFYLLKTALFFGWLCLGALIVRLGGVRPAPAPAGGGGGVAGGTGGGRAVNPSTPFYIVWGLLGGAALGLWWLARATHGRAVARPTEVVARLATGRYLRVVLVLVVMWLGWHLFAR